MIFTAETFPQGNHRMSIGPHQVLQLHLLEDLLLSILHRLSATKYHPNIKQTERALLDYLPEVALLHEAPQPLLLNKIVRRVVQHCLHQVQVTLLNKIDHRVVLLELHLVQIILLNKTDHRVVLTELHLVQAILLNKIVRQVGQHVLHPVKPLPFGNPHQVETLMLLDIHKTQLQINRLDQHLMPHNPNRYHVALIQEGHQEVEEKFHSSLKPIKPLNLVNLHLPELHSINRQQTKGFPSKPSQVHLARNRQVTLHKHSPKSPANHNKPQGE